MLSTRTQNPGVDWINSFMQERERKPWHSRHLTPFGSYRNRRYVFVKFLLRIFRIFVDEVFQGMIHAAVPLCFRPSYHFCFLYIMCCNSYQPTAVKQNENSLPTQSTHNVEHQKTSAILPSSVLTEKRCTTVLDREQSRPEPSRYS